jgi:hypothetical protein
MTKSELTKDAKPILFNTKMVRAILDGRKTQTRRIIKKLPENTYRIEHVDENLWEVSYGVSGNSICMDFYEKIKPPYKIGQVLYVRETWMNPCRDYCRKNDECDGCIYGRGYRYKADYRIKTDFEKWHPSIHMTKETARIFLKVTDIRVERLQDITVDGALKEGADISEGFKDFIKIWNSTIKKSDLDRYGWEANPWVWAVDFEKVEADTKC